MSCFRCSEALHEQALGCSLLPDLSHDRQCNICSTVCMHCGVIAAWQHSACLSWLQLELWLERPFPDLPAVCDDRLLFATRRVILLARQP